MIDLLFYKKQLILSFYDLILFLKEILDYKKNNQRNGYLLGVMGEEGFLTHLKILLIVKMHILQLINQKNFFCF